MERFAQHPIIYVTRDIERALGLPLDTPGYFIISNFTPFGNSIAKGRKNVLLIKEKRQLDTWGLLQHPKVKKMINAVCETTSLPLGASPLVKGRGNHRAPFLVEEGGLTTPPLANLPAGRHGGRCPDSHRGGEVNILVFKPTPQIEKICAEKGWKLLNPPAELSNKIEEKISQIEWLGELKKYLPKYHVLKCKEIEPFLKSQDNHFFDARTRRERSGPYSAAKKSDYPRFHQFQPFILQFNRSHTGSGTILVKNKKILENIQKTYPEREARIAPYIRGPLFTNNNIVAKDKILIGNISYQITGLMPFTDKQFATIGNDWALPRKILSKTQLARYKKIATDIGLRLRKAGWRGLFGIDVVCDEKTGRLYLLEINARQPASTTYESRLQNGAWSMEHGTRNKSHIIYHISYITTFEAHLASLLNIDLPKQNLIPITDGAQIVQRVTKHIPTLPEPKCLKKPPFDIIKYDNNKLGADLLRMQTKGGVMAGHNELNDIGKKMIDFIGCVRGGNVWDSLRAGVIIIKNKKLLVIERNKYGKRYSTLPGGTHEKKDGKLADTAVREALEETGLRVKLDTKKKSVKVTSNGRDETYFFVKSFTGKPVLGGPEQKLNSNENSYKLRWVEVKKLGKVNLLPEEIREKILKKS